MIRDVLVHVDGSPEDEFRLNHAEAIAAPAQARIIGLFTSLLPDFATLMPADGAAAAAGIFADLEADARRTGDQVQQRLAGRFARLSVPNEIRRIEGTLGQIAGNAASEARRADIFVAMRPYVGDGASQWDEIFEAVLFGSGRGVYVVPPRKKPSDTIRRVLVAWRDSRETARALAEAAPFIARATRTDVLVVDPETDASSGRSALDLDLARHLGRSGTQVEVSLIESEGRPVSEVVMDQARRMSADLVVMGAYGHSRVRQWIMGGTTLEMLGHSDIPILMAH